MPTAPTPVRTTVVAPVAAPYREPLFRALQARDDIELTVIYGDASQPSWDVPDGFFATAHDYPAVHLRARQLPRPGRTPVMFPRGIERALRQSAPEVIVASEYGPSAIRARLWAGAHHVPHLILTECTPEIDTLLPAAQLRWHRHFARHADGAVAVSSAARQRLLDFGVPADRVTVALQSADLVAIRSAAAAFRAGRLAPPAGPGPGSTGPGPGSTGPGPGSTGPAPGSTGPGLAPEASDSQPLRILSVARLVPDKNLATLLRATRQAATDLAPRRIRVDIVGAGFLSERLSAIAAELGLETTFHGHLGSLELAELYARADVFALLSAYEPFGVVIREAVAAGLPIISTGVVGAVGDVAIDGENASLVEPGDISGTAVALGRLLRYDLLRALMSERSQAIDAATAGTEVTAFAAAVLAARARLT